VKLGAKIEMIERQPVKVAFLRYTGPPGEPLGRFWRATMAPWLADHGLLDCPRYGVMLDDPGRTAPADCRYDACVELPDGLALPDAREATIAGGRYAVTHFTGTAGEVGAAWGSFSRATLAVPVNRLDPVRQPIEHYPRGAAYDTRTGVFACELCLPLSRQESRQDNTR
jgi:AraC family transcriptional regulator